MKSKSSKMTYSLDFIDPDGISLTFTYPGTKKEQKAIMHIPDPIYRSAFMDIIEFPLEQLEYGFYKDTITPREILDSAMDQVRYQEKLKYRSKPRKEVKATKATIYLESPSTQSFFTRDGEGNYIGYHWEGGEGYEKVGAIPLTLETLDNERPLFISPCKDEWDPKHLKDRDQYTLYEVLIKPMDMVRFTKFDVYLALLKQNPQTKKYEESQHLRGLKYNSFRLFALGDNDKGELQEAFLLMPKKYVLSIQKLDIT